MKKRIAVALLALALAATACSRVQRAGNGTASGRANAWTQPHILRYATAEDISTLNPLLDAQQTLGLMSSLTMAWLTKWNAQNKPIPELLTVEPTKGNGGISPDGKTITWHLRRGVKWSDGVPFTADDVVWSIHAILNSANNVISRTGWDRITKIDEPNKYTVILHLKAPYSPFVTTFFSSADANPCILPKHLLAQYPNINNVPYNSLPVGIGPFKYLRWDRGQDVVMVPNPLYFRGVPKLKRVIFEIIPNRDTVLTQMQAKQLDLWVFVSPAYVDRLKQLTPFHVLELPDYEYDHIDFNLSHEKLASLVVRRALRYATPLKRINDKIHHGIYRLQDQPNPKSAPYWMHGIGYTHYDIAKANQLLDAAGWKRGADGIRQKNGVRLAFNLATVVGTPDTDDIIELLRESWKQIGVSLSVRHYSSAQFFAPFQDGGIMYGNTWDVTLFAWGNDPLGDYSFLYKCDQFPPNGQNDVRWCDPKADAAMEALFSHFTQRERNADVATLTHQFIKDVPSIVEDGRVAIYAYNRDLKHFHPGSLTPFDNMMKVDI